MRDSLNLAELKQQIEQSKAQTERYNRWIGYIRIVLVVLIALSFGLSILYQVLRLRSNSLLVAMIMLLLVTLLAHTIYPVFTVWRNIREYSARIIAYAPEFVHRPKTLNMLLGLRSYIWLILAIAVGYWGYIYLHHSPLSMIAFFILAAGVYLFSQRLMGWINKGGAPSIKLALKVLPFSRQLQYYWATIAYQNQDFAQAEATMLKLLRTRTDYATPNVVLELLFLSECWTHQQRYDEVVPLIEAAIKISPIATLGYVSLAEWYLDREVDAERAVELLDIALANTPTKQTLLYAMFQSISAQALALTGRTIRARASLETALANMNKMPATMATEVHRRIGYAYKALGETETARTHFNRAIEIAPNDLYGDLARQALTSLAATT